MSILKHLPFVFVLVACASQKQPIESLHSLKGTIKEIKTGEELFSYNCMVCHGEKANGVIGPNLTDDYWIYGNSYQAIFTTIEKGTENGMPEHASKLTPEQMKDLTYFIQNLKPTEGKDPQGKKSSSK
jgi:cytochrome c oxidase cbb3-type subunit 3